VHFKRMTWLALVAAFAMVVAACGGGEAEETTTTTAAEATTTTAAPETTTTAAAAASLLVWADENRAPVVQAVAPAFTEATGVEVKVEIVDFGQIKDQVGVAGPAGEGPDIFVGAHDWTGELAANGAIDPRSTWEAKTGDFFPMWRSTPSTSRGQLCTRCLTPPRRSPCTTTPISLPRRLPPSKSSSGDLRYGSSASTTASVIPGGGDAGDAYHNYPFVSALGGYIFAYDPATGYDTSGRGPRQRSRRRRSVSSSSPTSSPTQAWWASTNYDNGQANLFLEGNAAVLGHRTRGSSARLNEQDTR
jgi:arabinogalactan oligomer / maltooligosaccharide transport system substrate-binding protein